ncbi:hypothetical protein Q8A73_008390 [Channa argus]|nr:hypothetical protein Q8A73_008390 [Channa argus]
MLPYRHKTITDKILLCEHNEFNGDSEHLLDKKSEKTSLLRKFSLVNRQTYAIRQENAILNLEVHEFKDKLANFEDFQQKYQDLKADREEGRNLKKLLEKQVHGLCKKLQMQTALEEKFMSVQEEKEQLIQCNQELQQEIEDILLKVKDSTELEVKYKRIKSETTSLIKQKHVLEKRVKDLIQKVSKVYQLEEKCRVEEYKNAALDQDCCNLQQQIKDLTEQLKDEEKTRTRYSILRNYKNYKINHSKKLKNQVQELKQRFEKLRPQLEKNFEIKVETEPIHKTRSPLTQAHRELQDKISQQSSLLSEHETVKSAKQNTDSDNSVLPQKSLDLCKKLQDSDTAEECEEDEERLVLEEQIQSLSLKLNGKVRADKTNAQEDKKEVVSLDDILQLHIEDLKKELADPLRVVDSRGGT